MTKKKHTPYIEITKYTDVKERHVLVATLWKGDDYWPGLEYTVSKVKSNTMANTKNGFLDRIRSWGLALGLEVEENF